MTVRPSRTGRRTQLWRRAAFACSLAGVVALGSLAGAHAAGQITGRQIKDGTVSGRDIRNGSLRASKVAPGTLRPADFAGDATGPEGPPGVTGPAGIVPGPPGFRGVTYVQGTPVDVTGFETVVATCPSATKVIGGGVDVTGGFLTDAISTSGPTSDGLSWLSTVSQSISGNTSAVVPWAICATAD